MSKLVPSAAYRASEIYLGSKEKGMKLREAVDMAVREYAGVSPFSVLSYLAGVGAATLGATIQGRQPAMDSAAEKGYEAARSQGTLPPLPELPDDNYDSLRSMADGMVARGEIDVYTGPDMGLGGWHPDDEQPPSGGISLG